jgi:dimethylargininase
MFSNAIVRPPCARFAEGLTTVDTGAPNHARALQQHAAYCKALEKCGLTLTRLEADERYPDSTFVEDTAVIVGALPNGPTPAGLPGWGFRGRASGAATSALGAILTRPGAASRVGEVEGIAEVLSRFYSELRSIQEPGTVDGGDVCEAENHFFIGISERTNEAGAWQFGKLLALYGYTSSYVDIRGVKNILHLKSGLAYLGDNRLAVIETLAEREEFHSYDLVRLNAGEEYAANCVRVNDRVLVAAGYPGFESTLQALDYQTIAVEMTEFQKMDGGLSCLSLRF